MTTRKIGIIGDGNVGSALARGFTRSGSDVRTIGKDVEGIRSLATWAEIVVLAVPFTAVDEVATSLGRTVAGKTLVDVTNALDGQMQLAVGFTSSGAEELQKRLPEARVVKAFNTQFAQQMDSGRLGDEQLAVFVAGDDASAKDEVKALASAVGFNPIDAGPLANARLLEPLGYLNIQLGYVLGMGTQIGLRLVHAA